MNYGSNLNRISFLPSALNVNIKKFKQARVNGGSDSEKFIFIMILKGKKYYSLYKFWIEMHKNVFLPD